MIAHVPALDGLRGLAILLVLAHHFTIVDMSTWYDVAITRVFHAGWAGVDLFFVLSGFLITGILIDARGSDRYFASFYARRTLRIFPLYYLVIFVSYTVLPLFPAWFDRLVGTGEVPRQIDYWLFLSNFSVAHRNAFQHGILDVSWSLAIEEQFYLLWAAVVWLCRPNMLGMVCAGVVLAVPALRWLAIDAAIPEVEIYVLPFYRADALAWGGLVAWATRTSLRERLIAFGPAMAIFGLAGVLGVMWYEGSPDASGDLMQSAGYTLLAMASTGALLTALAPSPGWWVRLLHTGWLRAFGRYSYCLYLIHLPVMRTVRDLVFDPTRASPIIDSALPAQAWFFALSTAAAFAIAWVSWHAFEAPVLRLRRFFSY